MTLQADLTALTTDAATWDDISLTLGTASASVDGLWLEISDLSWAAGVTGLAGTYTEFIAQVSGRLLEGSENSAELAGGLRQVHTAFTGADGSAQNKFDGLWDAVSE